MKYNGSRPCRYEFEEIAMAIEYTNKNGKTYYLHFGTTKTGKPKYFLAMRSGDTCADTMPDGFEIYEDPNGKVYLRKSLPKLISDQELAVVVRAIAGTAHLKDNPVDRKRE